MTRGYFVTGTDTGVGKTLISAALIHGFAQRGYQVAGMKPVAAGCSSVDGTLVSDDVVMLRAASNVVLPMHVCNPYAFEPPLAPHIAATQLGQRIEIRKITDAFQTASSMAEVVVVEGVGGFRVPLNPQEDTADLAARLGLPLVLVVGMRLGCLNHALLTVEAILNRGLPLMGWVANCIDPAMRSLEDNLQTLNQSIPAPCVGVVSYSAINDYTLVANTLDYDKFP